MIYEVGALAVDGWVVTVSIARRGLGWTGRDRSSPGLLSPRSHPSTASVYQLITELLYNTPLLCGSNVAIKG